MPKARRKTLPKDFDDLLAAGDLEALKAVFDVCELDARGGYSKETALAFYDCPDDLARWLVAQGADLEAADTYQRTPLHNRAGMARGRIDVLLELGADVAAADTYGDTPLHAAAKFANVAGVRALLAHGARADAVNAVTLTPLEAALQRCDNIQIPAMAEIAALLLPAAAPAKPGGLGGLIKRAFSGGEAGPQVTPAMREQVERIGKNFEFHRAGFNPDDLEETDAGLAKLYALFGVAPVPRRALHDGRAPIVAKAGDWRGQQQELWALLAPSSGPAATVQGEVIRIAGRIADEVDRNGAANWDADYRKMARAFVVHVGSGAPLPPDELARAGELATRATTLDEAGAGLCELAVHWVRLNPKPVALPPPDYDR